MCMVQLRCKVMSPVSVARGTSGRSSVVGSSSDGHTNARCEPAITRSWPDVGPAPVTEKCAE